jgi:hypothetical protein
VSRFQLEGSATRLGAWGQARDRAIQAADNGIRETQAGCAFADTH